jgi:mevalonate kinase
MGLGSSAAFSTALCTVLRQYKQLDHVRRWDNDLFDEVQRLEAIFHGNPSGIDAATVLSGGLLWFRPGPPREVLPLRSASPVTGVVCFVEPGARTIELVRGGRPRADSPHRRDRARIGGGPPRRGRLAAATTPGPAGCVPIMRTC